MSHDGPIIDAIRHTRVAVGRLRDEDGRMDADMVDGELYELEQRVADAAKKTGERTVMVFEFDNPPLAGSIRMSGCSGYRCVVYTTMAMARVNRISVVASPDASPWIPVTERMPEKGCFVLAWSEANVDWPTGYAVARVGSGRYPFWVETDEGNILCDNVTHWMPLPEPPK